VLINFAQNLRGANAAEASLTFGGGARVKASANNNAVVANKQTNNKQTNDFASRLLAYLISCAYL
jgi:hypothetical protein